MLGYWGVQAGLVHSLYEVLWDIIISTWGWITDTLYEVFLECLDSTQRWITDTL
jgi:hypothetical protein